MSISDFSAHIDEYVIGKTWYWYLPLWLIGLYAYIVLFQFNLVDGQLPFIWLIPYSFDFLLHEMAHIFTAFLPAVMTASAGSISELLLGVGLVTMALWQRSYFASMVCFLWLDLACQSAGQYMADAIPQRLPLVSLGGALSGQDPIHDWHFVFGQLHLLDISVFIGDSIRVFGLVTGFFGVTFAAWLIYKMSCTSRQKIEIKTDNTLSDTHKQKNNPPSGRIEDTGFTSLPFDEAMHDPLAQDRHEKDKA